MPRTKTNPPGPAFDWRLTLGMPGVFSPPFSIMANTRSAAKRARQTVGRTLQNKRALTGLKSELKKTRTILAAGDKTAAAAALRKMSSALDKAAKSGRIHKNQANRKKSRLNKRLAALA